VYACARGVSRLAFLFYLFIFLLISVTSRRPEPTDGAHSCRHHYALTHLRVILVYSYRCRGRTRNKLEQIRPPRSIAATFYLVGRCRWPDVDDARAYRLSLLFSFPDPCFIRRSRRRRTLRACKNIFSLFFFLYRPSLRIPRDLTYRRLAQRSPKRAARMTWRLCQRRGLCPSACRIVERRFRFRSVSSRSCLLLPPSLSRVSLAPAPRHAHLPARRCASILVRSLRATPLRRCTRASNYRLLKSGIHNIGQVEIGVSGGSNIDGLSSFTYTRLCRDGRRRARTALLPSTSLHTMYISYIYIYICIYNISLSLSLPLSLVTVLRLLLAMAEDRRRSPSHPRHERRTRSFPPYKETATATTTRADRPFPSLFSLSSVARATATRLAGVRARPCSAFGYMRAVRQSAAIAAAAANQSAPCICLPHRPPRHAPSSFLSLATICRCPPRAHPPYLRLPDLMESVVAIS